MSKERYRLIDALRGLALVNMLVFHFLYDCFMVYGFDTRWALYPGVVVWERYICVSFIVISGISLNFSRHAYRRGLIVNACGLLITLVTALVMPEQIIIFGILNLIGCSMILTQAARKLLDKVNPFVGAAVSFILFAFFYGFSEQYLGFFNLHLLELPDSLYRANTGQIILPPSAYTTTISFPPIIFRFLRGSFCSYSDSFCGESFAHCGGRRFSKSTSPFSDSSANTHFGFT